MGNAINLYLNWVLYAVFGRMAEADEILREHRAEIYMAAALFRRRYNLPAELKLYRGVIVDPALVSSGTLAPDLRLTYVSFSEDVRVARWFADPQSAVSTAVAAMFPQRRGYLIEHAPRPEEVLFHWSWGSNLKLVHAAMMHPHIDVAQFAWNLSRQREVIVAPVLDPFPVQPFVRVAEDDALDAWLLPPTFHIIDVQGAD